MISVKILGTGCKKCQTLESKVRDLVATNNIEATVEKITDIHPRSTTIFQSPETNIEYMTRVLQIEASKGILLKATVDTNGITYIEKVKL